jgi:hypothetical protein
LCLDPKNNVGTVWYVFWETVLWGVLEGPREMINWRRGKEYIVRKFVFCALYKILLGYSIKEDEMGRTCGTYGYEQ